MVTRKRNIDEVLGFSFFDGSDIHETLQDYSIANIKSICQKYVSTSAAVSRSDVYKVIECASSQIQGKIRDGVNDSMPKKYTRALYTAGSNCEAGPSRNQETSHHDVLDTEPSHSISSEDGLCENGFMRAPPKHVIDGAIADFIDRTSNSAMAVGACAVCARETNIADLTPRRLDHIPNHHQLRPAEPHPAHTIFKEMLLHPAGVSNAEIANVCVDCLRALNSNKTPVYALANGLWIGATPHELAYLTLPERLLIAKYFPAAYIIKLYPKKKGARHWDKRQLSSGLKGNVSTYQLDQGQIASMIDGTIMPQSAKLLAATIGITFVGPRNLPDKCIPGLFRVRRQRVQMALEWLKENNPLFANITISATRLAELPENDIPYELCVTARHSTDVDKLDAEHEGYVPSQETLDDGSDDGMYFCLLNGSILNRILQTRTRARWKVSRNVFCLLISIDPS